MVGVLSVGRKIGHGNAHGNGHVNRSLPSVKYREMMQSGLAAAAWLLYVV